MQDELIRCPECGFHYNPKYLDEVAYHMHAGVVVDQTIKGERVMEEHKLSESTIADIIKHIAPRVMMIDIGENNRLCLLFRTDPDDVVNIRSFMWGIGEQIENICPDQEMKVNASLVSFEVEKKYGDMFVEALTDQMPRLPDQNLAKRLVNKEFK